jgi:hypothetical protein
MDTSLQTDLGRPSVPGLFGASTDFLQIEDVGCAPQVIRYLSLRESTKLTFVLAQVRVVNVPVNYEGNVVSTNLATHGIRSGTDRFERVSARLEQRDNFLIRKASAVFRL